MDLFCFSKKTLPFPRIVCFDLLFFYLVQGNGVHERHNVCNSNK